MKKAKKIQKDQGAALPNTTPPSDTAARAAKKLRKMRKKEKGDEGDADAEAVSETDSVNVSEAVAASPPGQETKKKRTPPSVPGNGYVCKACDQPGHWVYDCPRKRKNKRSKTSGHTLDDEQRAKHRDPTAEDIAKAQAAMPVIRMADAPKCRCGLRSAPRKNRAQGSPGHGLMFWWWSV